MMEKIVTVKNRAGIHARPASILVKVASKFSSEIFIEKQNGHERVNGKSIMGIITLGATHKSKLKIIANGSDEEKAIQTLIKLFENRFEEK